MVEEMTRFERVQAVMEVREPDRVPVYPYILTYGAYAEGWKLPDITTDTTLDTKIAGFHSDEKHPPEWLQKNVKKKYHISIAGIIHGPGPLLNGPASEIDSVTKNIIDKASIGGCLMMAPSYEVPPDTPMDNFKRWVEVTHTYGKYPLSHEAVVMHANG